LDESGRRRVLVEVVDLLIACFRKSYVEAYSPGYTTK
jgi:hypothetical protein